MKQQYPKNFKIVILHLPTNTIVYNHLALELMKYCLEQNKGRQEKDEEEKKEKQNSILISFLESVHAHKTDKVIHYNTRAKKLSDNLMLA